MRREDGFVLDGRSPHGDDTERYDRNPVVPFEVTGVLGFRSDFEKRRVSGRIVEWDQIARSGGRRWRFRRGSLYWADVSRVKLNRGHSFDEVVGVAESIRETAEGLDAVFKVARTSAGDDVLQLVRDGAVDGFSIEPAMEETLPDPGDRTVTIVTRARLHGVALTGYPAYDNARVSAVFERDLRPGPDPRGAETDIGYHGEDRPVFPPMPANTERVVAAYARPSKTRTRQVTNRATGGTELVTEELPDPVPGAVSTYRVHRIHSPSAAARVPEEFGLDAEQQARFWREVELHG